MSVAVNPPKTPVTKGSNSISAATIPNVCKMPGPPAPFVPTPLPNIGRSSLSPKGYSKKVKIKKKPVAIKGATFASQGDVASKGTGGGLISANTHGPTKFVGPGALDVKIEGKNVQLLADPMLNNCGPSGNPPNSATLMGTVHKPDMAKKKSRDDCDHPNWKRSEQKKDSEKRKELDDKIAAEKAKSDDLLNKALAAEGAGNPGAASEFLRKSIEAERQSDAFKFEKEVAEQTKAKEVSVYFECTDCDLNGEIDVVTEDGTVKEAKTGKPDLQQVKKIKMAAATLFPGAPVHLALPHGYKTGVKWAPIQRH